MDLSNALRSACALATLRYTARIWVAGTAPDESIAWIPSAIIFGSFWSAAALSARLPMTYLSSLFFALALASASLAGMLALSLALTAVCSSWMAFRAPGDTFG